MKNGYYITSDGTKHILEPNNSIYLCNMGIIELVLPDGIKIINCRDNKLTELIIPEGTERVWCWGNELTKLDLPDSVIKADCYFNKLTELIVPDILLNNYSEEALLGYDNDCIPISRTMFNRSKHLKSILKT
jgi:hypothetical protein